MSDIIIELKDVYKTFGPQRVLNGVNLKVNRGETLSVIGNSGCGKSVLIKHLIGLLQPDSGTIVVDGYDINKISDNELTEVRKKFAMVFQGAALFDSLNVYENVSFGLRRIKKDMPEDRIKVKVAEVLEMVGMPNIEHKMPSELSGGMKKRVGLARAIAMDPQILLYDEPTTGLDPVMSRVIDDLIVKMQSILNVTSIVITHDMTSVFRMSDRVVMLYKGQIIEGGDPDHLGETENPHLKFFFMSSIAKKGEDIESIRPKD
ncbi:ABC transporter ATP-binding protein [uncultured Brachyspira sp.]|uniref:ABC transporter ATP-binding protein n=1 Tax=uncultured Brachyspira sp. TaxID=221953 RepID=UPI00260B8F07|nr:ABC transporter ATP-binding protein [uncultured Brachyspira sp.]